MKKYDILIRNGNIFNGNDFTGVRDIAISDGEIQDIDFEIEGNATNEIDASGFVVSPGFIDMHSHMDNRLSILNSYPVNKITQGITTEVVGQCGIGKCNLEQFTKEFYKKGSPNNFIPLTPHGTLKKSIFGAADHLNTSQMQLFKDSLQYEMEMGSWGMSSGLIYAPGINTKTDELIELCSVIAPMGGIYFTHMRSERDGILDALDEAITIGKEANIQVHVSHLKITGLENAPLIKKVIEKFENARADGININADQYPYTATAASLKVLLPDDILNKMVQYGENCLNKSEEEYCLNFLKEKIENRGSSKIIFASLSQRPELSGKTLEGTAKRLNVLEEKLVLDIIKEGNPATSLFFTIDYKVVNDIMKLPYVAIGTDGSGYDKDWMKEKFPHPREIATFPEAYKKGIDNGLSIPAIFNKFTALPSGILNSDKFGCLKIGAKADIAIIDLKKYTANANYTNPRSLTSGVNTLIVNGQLVIKNKKFTGKRPGIILNKIKENYLSISKI